ncbi:MAG: AAA family ATPase [Chloroflexi bacterium]|nr:AAA family ATPase [Chloroflexota bacterium]
MAKLKLVHARALRGLRDLEIPFEGKSLLLWGENGSGKSSLVDAIEFLFTGKISHLEGTRGLSLERHAPHLELGAAAMEVQGTFDPGAIAVSRSLTSPPAIPPVLASTWETAKFGNYVLRRSQLLTFIHADPADRFRAVGSLIGIEALDAMELAIMRARDRFEGETVAKQRQVGLIKIGLGNIIGTGEAMPEEVMKALNKDASGLGLSFLSSAGDISEKTQEWMRSAKQADQPQIGTFNNLKARAEAVTIAGDLAGRLKRYQDAYAQLASRGDTIDRLSEAELLDQGQKILVNASPNICPLCEQPIDLGSTLARIRERQHLLKELSTEFSGFRMLCQELASTLSSLGEQGTGLKEIVPDSLDPDSSIRARLSQIATNLETLGRSIQASTNLTQVCDVDRVLRESSVYESARKELVERAGKALGALALTERDKAILDLTQKALRLELQWRDLAKHMKELEWLTELQRRARYVFNTFSASKKAEVTRVYEAIEADVRNFYERLHPGESHSEFQLVLAQTRRASTELRIKAFGQERTDPRAFTSEGHLDSLGLCIFLSFVKHFMEDWQFIVLDDVIMSIDSSHRGRVADLLLTEFSDWQLVITTHDEIWFEEFVNYERAYKKEGQFLNRRIHRWSLGEGAVVQPYRPRWEQISDKIAAADKTGAANDGRQFLEWILTEICVRTMAQVPLKRDARYTVQDLIGPAQERLTKLLPGKTSEITGIFRNIQATSTPGNLLSHSNANAPSLSVTEIQQFCEATKALHDWFTCPGCSQLPSYIQSAGLIRCPNSRCPAPLQWTTS